MKEPRGEVSDTITKPELLTEMGFKEESLDQSQAESQEEQQGRPWPVLEGARAAPHSSVLIPPLQVL